MQCEDQQCADRAATLNHVKYQRHDHDNRNQLVALRVECHASRKDPDVRRSVMRLTLFERKQSVLKRRLVEPTAEIEGLYRCATLV